MLKAVGLMGLFCVVYYYPYGRESVMARAIELYLQLQAQGSAALIALFDPQVAVSGTTISGRFPVQIVKSCSSLDAQALYAAAVLAFPARSLDKAWGLALGVALLGSLNLARIAGLYFVGANMPGWFDSVHEELLPFLLVSAACLAFVAWLSWTQRVGGPDVA